MKSASYNIGDWVIDEDDKIVKIIAHDMDDLPYEKIKRDCTPDEIPEFEVEIKEGDNLNKENFFNLCQQCCPLAMGAFCKWIDAYKIGVDWKELFAERVKFHDIPFEMQVGILVSFFHEVDPEWFYSISLEKGPDRYEIICSIIDNFVDIEVDQRNKGK